MFGTLLAVAGAVVGVGALLGATGWYLIFRMLDEDRPWSSGSSSGSSSGRVTTPPPSVPPTLPPQVSSPGAKPTSGSLAAIKTKAPQLANRRDRRHSRTKAPSSQLPTTSNDRVVRILARTFYREARWLGHNNIIIIAQELIAQVREEWTADQRR